MRDWGWSGGTGQQVSEITVMEDEVNNRWIRGGSEVTSLARIYLYSGVATKFRPGGDGFRLRGGGRIHLPRNSYFSSDFAHFTLEVLENKKM